MNITTFTGYALPQVKLQDDALTWAIDALNNAQDCPFDYADDMIVPRIEEIDTSGIYNAYRYDILSTLAWLFHYPVFLNAKFKGEFTISTYTTDLNGNTHEVSQVIEIIDSIAYPTLKVNPNASSFSSKTPAYTREDLDKAIREEADASYRIGYDEGFIEGEESAQMDMAYNSANYDEAF